MQLTFAEKKLLATLVESYATDPNGTLYECFEIFGRQEFEDTIRVILPFHLAEVSMKMAIRRCMMKQKERDLHYRETVGCDLQEVFQ